MYGNPAPYQSSLRVMACYPSVVTYSDTRTGEFVGKVYKNDEGKWFLETVYLDSYSPVEVFTKYQGFLFLKKLHSNNEL